MVKAVKKFGTFSGVFTPSILTILGVIMYMRLGWVVGQAGLIAAITIVVIAHVISITTGLSISSIATDKKIKTGGIYYILSRSLGLPIGGAIGITIFVGTALSISLYIIGFCESFLGVGKISEFLGLPPSVDSFRIAGSAVLLLLALIAFISTSLAIKAQYIVLSAILLSLISVFAGLFTNTEFHPQQLSLMPLEGGEGMEYIFAIFFPAVTGFTAGVAMSGDLKNPKRNIPWGTMIAIVTGLVIYLALTLGFALFVDRDILVSDNNFLMKIAWVGPLLIAGIWGATLSSALGGILGGPRILQAISQDKITPRFFGKGYGPSNEPRNALLLTFFIAEAGILIGELNIIAGLVSMFYIAAYGFINFSFTLERWASSDFRPTFRISKWVGIVGFVACFAVMFKIDTLAMIAALLIITGIYVYLKNKLLELDFGDVWQSVWTSVVRRTLHEMDKKQLEERNWKPNIILFSGSTQARPFLIEFGKDLAGNHGFLSNFDLIENPGAEVLFPKHEQSLQTEDSLRYKGVFTRKQECRNFYDGVEMIASTYGFAGVEPNTVLLAWGRQSSIPERFAKAVRILTELDLNVLMMDYDADRGFGRRKKIDIWWRGRGNNGNLALSLVRFIWLSENWRDSTLRLLIVNPVNSEKERILNETAAVLDNLRIDAEIRVINNEIEQRPFYQIIEEESLKSDLTFLGIPDIEPGKEKDFVARTNELCAHIGTVVLIKASSRFKELNIGVTPARAGNNETIQKEIDSFYEKKEDLPLQQPSDEKLESYFNSLNDQFTGLLEKYYGALITRILEGNLETLKRLGDLINDHYRNLLAKADKTSVTDPFSGPSSRFLKELNALMEERQLVKNQDYRKLLETAFEDMQKELKTVYNTLPVKLTTRLKRENLAVLRKDRMKCRVRKSFFRLSNLLGKDNYTLKYRKLVEKNVDNHFFSIINGFFGRLGQTSLKFDLEIQKLVQQLMEGSGAISGKIAEGTINENAILIEQRRILKLLRQQEVWVKESMQNNFREMLTGKNFLVSQIVNEIEKFPAEKVKGISGSQVAEREEFMRMLPDKWLNNQQLILNRVLAEIILSFAGQKAAATLNSLGLRLSRQIAAQIITPFSDFLELTGRINYDKSRTDICDRIMLLKMPSGQEIRDYLKKTTDELNRKVRSISRFFPEHAEVVAQSSLKDFEALQFKQLQAVSIPIARLADYSAQTSIAGPFAEKIRMLPEELEEIVKLFRESRQIISFYCGNKSNAGNSQEEDDMKREVVARISRGIERTKGLQQRIEAGIGDISEKLTDVFTLSRFTQMAANFRYLSRKREKGSRFRWFRGTFKRITSGIGSFATELLYHRSKGMVFASRISLASRMGGSPLSPLINMVDSAGISEDVKESLPLFYRQMFAGSLNNVTEFWTGRNRELELFKKYLERFRRGYAGGILISGNPGAGKTFLIQKATGLFLQNSNIYYVTPPPEGSVDTRVFKSAVSEAVGYTGEFTDALARLSKGSVVVLEDIELWWEKSEGGTAVIRLLSDLIKRYSDNVLFVASVNSISYNLMSRFEDLGTCFLGIVELDPLDAKEIRNTVMQRHNNSTLKIRMESSNRNVLRPWDMARLFSKIFHISGGNPGAALKTWLNCIKKADENNLWVSAPRYPDLYPIEAMDVKWHMLISHFLHHRRLTNEKLARIMRLDKTQAETMTEEPAKWLEDLKRAGLITETGPGIYELNGWITHYIVARYREMEII